MYRASARADEYLGALFLNDIARFSVEMLVWGDEFGTNRNDAATRTRGRAFRGARAVDRGYVLNRKHYSCLAFMTMDGLLTHYTVRGAINSERLIYFTTTELISHMNPFPGPRSVLILDNASIHHSTAFLELVQSAGILLKYLPHTVPGLTLLSLCSEV